MKRRGFLTLGVSAPVLFAQQAPQKPDPVELMLPGESPALALNHVGFTPKARKQVIFRYSGDFGPDEFTLRQLGGGSTLLEEKRPLKRYDSDVITCYSGDFSSVEREGMYQVTVGDETSVPFFIRPDVWRRTLPKAVGYYRLQRCGAAVPNVHPACHLDDGTVNSGSGQRTMDATGGWHDSGNLRKATGISLLSAVAMLRLARNLGEKWDPAGLASLYDEVRWGNRYFLKFRDSEGRVFNGTQSTGDADAHWTDNQPGTADDRALGIVKTSMDQAIFITLEAMLYQALRESDAPYAKICLDAATRCWQTAQHGGVSALELSWWTLAALELQRATRSAEIQTAAGQTANRLLALQNTTFIGDQKELRGFWRSSEQLEDTWRANELFNPIYSDPVWSALPAIALLEAATSLPEHPDAARWRDAVRLHLDEYAQPMTARSAYEIMPFGLYLGSPTSEVYRTFSGDLTYRYFMPVRRQPAWLGTTSHLECYALLFAMAAAAFNQKRYRDLAYSQLEWVMGANPFGACLMTGEGIRNPYPDSRFVGLIAGGLMSGIAGNARDEPVLDMENALDWRTAAYSSSHNAWYIWTHAVLERG
jgi:hypothetical protein